jgi:TRAP-type C4-dicarboxylate transport system permease small subunit
MLSNGLTRLRQLAARAAEAIVSLMFAAVFLVFVYKVVMRYARADAVAWADEVSVILFIWIIFWANAFVVGARRQISFDLVYRLLSPPARRVSRIVRLLVVGGLFAWALPSVIDYIAFLWRERTPVLSLPLDLVYSCFGLFALAIVVRSVAELYRLLSRDWRSHV